MRTQRAIGMLGIFLLAISSTVDAGDRDRFVRLPAKANWHDLPGVDGRLHSLADLADRDVVVVAITCNHCPIALEYLGRMKAFADRHCGPDGRVSLVAISLSHLETDKLPRMKELSQRNGFNFPYLYDESQKIGKNLGATITPQFFVLNRERFVVYKGGWDDDVNESKVKVRFVESAVEALLAGKVPPRKESTARGCLIDYR